MTRVIAACLVLIGVLTPHVQASDRRNGATWYGQAFDAMPTLTDEQWELVDRYRAHPGPAPSAELRQILARVDRAMSLARRGAKQRYSDFQLDYGEGFALTLPHLAKSRVLARLMEADALVKLHDGDSAAAADRVASVYRMGSHLGQDRIVISSLVGQVVWQAGDQALQAMLDRGALSPAEAAVVLQAIEALPPTDPFSYVDATIMEYELVAQTIENHIAQDGLVDLDMLALTAGDEPAGSTLMTAKEVDENLDLFAQYMDDVVEVFVEADPERGPKELETLRQKIVDGEFGKIAQRFAPALNKVFLRRLEVERRIAERAGMLEGLLAGQVDVRTQANAAVWYLRAIETLHRKPGDRLAALRRDTPAPGQAVEPEVVSLLGECKDVLGLLREASEMVRCDFNLAHEHFDVPVVAPTYAVGLRDLLRLIMADVRHRQAEGDRETLTGRLRIAWSMVKHFESDPMFTTVITNHQAFNRLVPLTMNAVKTGLVTAQQHAELASLAQQLRRTDPFGYVAATVRARKNVTRSLYDSMVFVDSATIKERYEALDRTVRGFETDLLVYLAAVMDTARHAEDADRQKHNASLARLEGVLDVEALSVAQAEAGQLLPLMSPEVGGLGDRAVPDIASVDRRRSQARRDLRRGLQTLRPDQSPPVSSP